MNKDEFEDKAKERVLLVEEANSTLKKLFSEATTLGLNVQYVKSKAGEVIRNVEAELNKQEAPKEVKDQIILSLKKSVVDWYNYTTYYLERRAKVAKNPVERNLYINTVAALSGKGGAKTITMGNNEQVSNLREYVMSSEKGYGNLIIPDYDKKIKNDINQLMTDISEKRLTLFDSLGRRKSIRNLAEISARTEAMRSHLLEQKEKGVKYVLSSQHADCSERCRWWQNKVFIIDCDIKNYLMQTYDPHNPPTPKPIGKVDGIDYYSLDEAINYGFLGYNCRHNLIPYQKGMYIPKSIPQNRVEKERNLEIVQRRLECKVRDAKLHEITAVSKEERQKAIADSKAYQTKYDEFCKKNGLVKYEWRCRITKEERDGLPIIEENAITKEKENYEIPEYCEVSGDYKTEEYKQSIKDNIPNQDVAHEVIRCSKLIFDYEKSRKVESVCIIDKNNLNNTYYNPNGDPASVRITSDGLDMLKKDGDYIIIHNHRGSSPPSYGDLKSAYTRKKLEINCDNIILANDGKIYYYKLLDFVSDNDYNEYVEGRSNQEMEAGLYEIAKKYGKERFIFERWR